MFESQAVYRAEAPADTAASVLELVGRYQMAKQEYEHSRQATAQPVIKQVVCPECGQTFVPTDFTVRPVEGYPTLKNVGISCPHCEWFGHLFVEDMRLRRRRATVAMRRKDWERHKTPGKWRQVEKAKEELGRVFDEVQAKWRPLLGLTPIMQAGKDGPGGNEQ